MAVSPFGRETRMRVLNAYFDEAGPVTIDNAWEHVYRCLLWQNVTAGLAHIYDSNHMQPGGTFHSRAVHFTDLLCAQFETDRAGLFTQIDRLFKGCIEVFKERLRERPELLDADPTEEVKTSDLHVSIRRILIESGLKVSRADDVATQIEGLSQDYFTIGNKRKNALGEGLEDLLEILLQRVALVPASRIAVRRGVSKLPGFKRSPMNEPGKRREPKPDIAIIQDDITHVIITAKWSIRQDREQQFSSEYHAFQMNKVQRTELQYFLITNEFDVARLNNSAAAIPGGRGDYIFHHIYHINADLLRETHGQKGSRIGAWIQTGKVQSLTHLLRNMKAQFGNDGEAS